MSKLTALHISLIGGGVVLVMGLILYFAMHQAQRGRDPDLRQRHRSRNSGRWYTG